jgi:capsular polysaccharide biosynthesis protein
MHMIRAVRDIAGHVSEGESPAVDFHRLLAASQSAARPPLFLLGETNPLVTGQLFGQIETPQVGCYALADAAVAPTGIALKDGTAFCSAAFVHPPHHVVTIIDRLNASSLPLRHIPGPLAVIYGPGHQTYGHWLIDFLPRLAVLNETGHDIAKLRFLIPPDLGDFAPALLRLCGITDDQLVRYDYWNEIVVTDLLLMPTGLRLVDRMSPFFAEATQFWIKRVRARAKPTAQHPHEQIFISRAGVTPQRDMANRAAIEAIARRHGLHVVHPEKMSLLEQMALFEPASVIVGEYGSGLHNSVFARAGTLVCGLRGNSRHPGFVQSGIATALNQQAGYVFGNTEGQDVEQYFTIDEAAFTQAIELMSLVRLANSKEAVLF